MPACAYLCVYAHAHAHVCVSKRMHACTSVRVRMRQIVDARAVSGMQLNIPRIIMQKRAIIENEVIYSAILC